MLDDEFDDKIKQAAQDGIPPFEEKDWDQMEALLDKHLPVKKDRRRFFFFFLLIPVGIGMAYFIYHITASPAANQLAESKHLATRATDKEPTRQKTSIPGENKKGAELPVQSIPATKGNKNLPSYPAEKRTETNNSLSTTPSTTINKKTPAQKQPVLSAKKLKPGSPVVVTQANGEKKELKALSTNEKKDVNNPLKNENAAITKATKAKQFPTVVEKKGYDTTNIRTSIQPSKTATGKDSVLVVQKSEGADSLSNNGIAQQKTGAAKRRKSALDLTLTLGWEANGTAIQSLGTLTPVYGPGLQYSYGRVFLRTGLLTTKKIYAAKDRDYNRKSGTWMSAVTFDNIQADCRVIEVPISLGYKLTSNKKTNVYITAGTSAYFMKKEDYQFYFKNSSGIDTTRSASFTNNSNHYFSSLNLSAGIERKVNSRLSLMAEPLLKIPLSGIGFGKVKLYGAGLLLTTKFRLK